MMRRPPPLILLVLGFLASSPIKAEPEAVAVKGENADTNPVEMVRSLQALQDQIAVGSTMAHAAQRVLLTRIDETLFPLDPQAWQDKKNVRAAVTFVLSGGKPVILRKLLSLGVLSGQDERIVQGALAYVEGREADAKRYFNDIDVVTLPPSLAGQMALVKSALTVRDDPAGSMQLLDYVRLQLPGTLVEESALRRAIFVASQTGDINKFEFLARQYIRRFRHSIYSGNFRQRFAMALTQLEFTRDPNQFGRLVVILNEMEPDSRRELYLLVARSAIDQGRTSAAILASDKALVLSDSDKVSASRARLYRAAATIVTAKGFDPGVDELRKIDRAALSVNDLTLLDSALSMANYIRNSPESPPVGKATSDQTNVAAQSPAISRAQDALGRVDQLFRREMR
ncbi:chemotaxis protein [Microvirga terricola]|uniref:Chemotaxis protein MotC n=1 Tax=Microvirga terricola TaxID=2719797 RepID=A0ABX0V9C3_9HYPH|nr:chemotaxis protein [Microvirga terricola]NIX75001.1 chemotaxis protein MotC [Microvirga terricola]